MSRRPPLARYLARVTVVRGDAEPFFVDPRARALGPLPVRPDHAHALAYVVVERAFAARVRVAHGRAHRRQQQQNDGRRKSHRGSSRPA